MNNNIEKYELQLLYISQVASIIFIIISLIAIFLTHHDIKVLKHEKTLITDEESYNISYFNRILIIIILLIFLYISDENRKIAELKRGSLRQVWGFKNSDAFEHSPPSSLLCTGTF